MRITSYRGTAFDDVLVDIGCNAVGEIHGVHLDPMRLRIATLIAAFSFGAACSFGEVELPTVPVSV